MSTNGISFPPEIIDAFVERLAAKSDSGSFDETIRSQSLLACSLSSRSFAAAARRRLFSTVTIGLYKKQTGLQLRFERSEKEMADRINTLTDLLADGQSDLALLVHRVQINVDPERTVLASQLNLNALLSTLRQRALSTNTLSIQSKAIELSWTEIPPPTASLFIDLCRSLPISCVHFVWISDIPTSIAAVHSCPHLTTIDLAYSGFANITNSANGQGSAASKKEAKDGTTEVQKIVLSELLDTGKYQVRYGTDGELLVTAVCVQIFNTEHSMILLLNLMERVSVSLELCTCSINFNDLHADFLPMNRIDLGTMTQLRKVVIRRYTNFLGTTTIELSIADLAKLLHHGAEESQVEEVELLVGLKIPYGCLDDMDQMDYGAAKQLQLDVLRVKYPVIQRVLFTLDIILLVAPFELSPTDEDIKALEGQYQANILKAIMSNNSDTNSLPAVRVIIRSRKLDRSYID